MKLYDLEQGTQEWLNIRAGKFSSSEAKKIITGTGKRSTGSTHDNYLYQIAGERITGIPEMSGPKSAAMRRGNDLEPEARAWYALSYAKTEVATTGFCVDDTGWFGCSPDGLMEDEKKGLEIKCPGYAEHGNTIEKGKLPTKHIPQIQFSLWVTGFDSWDFLSYHPGLDDFQCTVYPDLAYHELIEKYFKEAQEKVMANMEILNGNNTRQST